MGRHNTQRSYGHRIIDRGSYFILMWTVDRYIKGSRLRFPADYSREADEAGAVRFAKRWGLKDCRDKPPTG